jgi:universal stress protein E
MMKRSKNEFHRILVATDFSSAADAALKQAVWLEKTTGAKVTLAHVLPNLKSSSRTLSGPKMQMLMELMYSEGEEFVEFEEEVRRNAFSQMQKAIIAAGASELGVQCEVFQGEAIVELVHAVQAGRFDLVMTGRRGSAGWEKLLLGSTANRAIRKCPSSVWIVNEDNFRPPNVILAATDFSEASEKATKYGLRLSQQAKAEFHLLHVIDSMDVPEDLISKTPRGSSLRDEIRDEAKRHLDAFISSLEVDPSTITKHLSWGSPWKDISHLAERLGTDLITMGTTGRSGIQGLLLGNTAEKVLGACNCSILTTKPSEFVSPIT